MVVEETARGQRVGEQGAAAIGELDHRIPRAGPQHATATEDDRPLCRGQPLDGLGHERGIGVHAPDLGLIHFRGLVGLVGHVLDLLQVVGNAQHHRPPLVLGEVEGLAHVVHHARHAVRGDVMRPGRRHERRLIDRLVVVFGVDRRLAGEHHHRQAGAHRGRQRRHQLGHAGAARDGGNGDLAGGHVVGCRRRHSGVLVPDVDGLYARQLGKGGGPVHVAVAHQDELRVDSLRKERFCEGFVEFWHGRGTFVVEACRWHPCRRCNAWDSAPPASGSEETLHQACAPAEGGIVFFSCRTESARDTERRTPPPPICARPRGHCGHWPPAPSCPSRLPRPDTVVPLLLQQRSRI